MNRKKQKGILTFDFIFSFMMIIGLFQIYYYLTYTLIAAHATQYVMYSSARAFFAGHHKVEFQDQQALKKFVDLTEDSVLSTFYNGRVVLSDFEAREFTEYPTSEAYRQKFIGTRVTLNARVLDVRIPLFGSTGSQLEGQGFIAEMGAYLYREPTSLDCLGFNNDRARAIKRLGNGKYQQAEAYGFSNNATDLGAFSDNGC